MFSTAVLITNFSQILYYFGYAKDFILPDWLFLINKSDGKDEQIASTVFAVMNQIYVSKLIVLAEEQLYD